LAFNVIVKGVLANNEWLTASKFALDEMDELMEQYDCQQAQLNE
jgi:hypothetical protein